MSECLPMLKLRLVKMSECVIQVASNKYIWPLLYIVKWAGVFGMDLEIINILRAR
jgi:hypothetical protein